MPDTPATDTPAGTPVAAPTPIVRTPSAPEPAAPAAPAPAPVVAPEVPVATTDVVLFIAAPWTTAWFDPRVDGWEPIGRAGTAGPAATADAVIASALNAGVTLERRENRG